MYDSALRSEDTLMKVGFISTATTHGHVVWMLAHVVWMLAATERVGVYTFPAPSIQLLVLFPPGTVSVC